MESTQLIIDTRQAQFEIKTCARCRNAWTETHLMKGPDWNDFGIRYCPFCGLLTDESGAIVE